MYTPVVRFEWDPEKNTANLRKHGIDFATAIRVFQDCVLERMDDRYDYGEIRIAAIGRVDGIEVTVYYTERSGVRRIISARKATRNERKAYYNALTFQG